MTRGRSGWARRRPARRSGRAPRTRRRGPSAPRSRSRWRRRGVRQIAAPSSVPPTPANGSSTSSPPLVKNSISRAISRGGLLAPCALRVGVPQLGRIGRRPERLGEVEPLLAGQLVEAVVRVHRTDWHRPSMRSGPPGMLPRMAFVGRERELAQLAGALQRGAEGKTSRVAVSGSAGVGVSRLLDELISRMAGLPGLVVARGVASGADPRRPVRTDLGRARSRDVGNLGRRWSSWSERPAMTWRPCCRGWSRGSTASASTTSVRGWRRPSSLPAA